MELDLGVREQGNSKRLSSKDMFEFDCVSIFELCDESDWKYFVYGSRKKSAVSGKAETYC